eukprot:8401679-Lingulodinium_polyedra.AAC.1
MAGKEHSCTRLQHVDVHILAPRQGGTQVPLHSSKGPSSTSWKNGSGTAAGGPSSTSLAKGITVA